MKTTKAEKFFWMLILVLIIMAILSDRPIVSVITIVICTIPINPLILNKIQRKIDGSKFDFTYLLKFLLPFFVFIFVIYLGFAFSGLLVKNPNDLYRKVEDIEASITVLMYLAFIAVLFFYKNEDKKRKYVIFGVFYIFCTALTFFSESMVDIIISFLNKISVDYISFESCRMLYSTVLNPIKEAILTYIVFDVIFDEKDDKKKENKVNGTNSDSVESTLLKQFSVDVLDEQTLKTEKYKIIVQK